MKTKAISPSTSSRRALSLIELVVILAMLVVLAGLFLSADSHGSKTKAQRINCLNHFRQIGLAFRVWADNHNRDYPLNLADNSGTAETWKVFRAMSNELVSLSIPVCPADDRVPAANWQSLANVNVSYFLCLDSAPANPEMLLSGDRNITNGLKTTNRILVVGVNAQPNWTHQMHKGRGNILYSDGTVQQDNSAKLSEAVRSMTSITNATLRLAMPE